MGYFNPRTYTWEEGDPNSAFMYLTKQDMEGNPTPPPVSGPPPSVGVDDERFQPSLAGQPGLGTRFAQPGANRYGGSADYLNSLSRASDMANDTYGRQLASTRERRFRQDDEIKALEDQLFSTGRQGVAYQHPENIASNQQKMAQLTQLIATLKGAQAPQPTFQSPFDERVLGVLGGIEKQEKEARQDVTNRAVAEAYGFKTPPGATPPTADVAKGIAAEGRSRSEEGRKEAAAKRAGENAASLNAMRNATTEAKRKMLRGDLNANQLNAIVKDQRKVQALLREALDIDPNNTNAKLEYEEVSQMISDAQRQLSEKVTGQPYSPPAATKEPQSSGGLSWLTNLLSNLGEGKVSMSGPPAEGEAPQSRQQAPVTQQGPVVVSSAVRKAKALKERVDSGLANQTEQQTYSRWYDLYTQNKGKMTPERAREMASRAIFGDM